MNCKELGETGIRLPEIGLGTWEFKGGVNALRSGIDADAFLVDTAESYGIGRLELALRRIVRRTILTVRHR